MGVLTKNLVLLSNHLTEIDKPNATNVVLAAYEEIKLLEYSIRAYCREELGDLNLGDDEAIDYFKTFGKCRYVK